MQNTSSIKPISIKDKWSLTLGLLCLASFIYVYYGTFLWLYERYTIPDSDYSHGFLIPLISGYFIWKKRNILEAIPAAGSKTGLFFIILALLIHIGSVWTHVFFTSGFSMLLLLIGFSLYFFGREFTKAISFPLAFLFFMFPLPMGVIGAISFPLKMMVSNLQKKI